MLWPSKRKASPPAGTRPEDANGTEQVDSKRQTQPHISEHLANERTYLAYLRTSVSLISFGITINRFSLYLEQSRLMPQRSAYWGLADVGRLGFGMVIFGICLLLFAAVHFTLVGRAIDQENYHPQNLMIWVITFGVLMGGTIGLIWLFQR